MTCGASFIVEQSLFGTINAILLSIFVRAEWHSRKALAAAPRNAKKSTGDSLDINVVIRRVGSLLAVVNMVAWIDPGWFHLLSSSCSAHCGVLQWPRAA